MNKKNNKLKVLLQITIELIVIGGIGIFLLWISNSYIFKNPSKPLFRLIGSAVYAILLTVFFVVKKPSIKELGLNLNDEKRKTKIRYLLGLILFVLMVIISVTLLDPTFFNFTMILRFSIFSALLEEIIFRGYIWDKLKKNKFNNISLIIITGLFFGLFHLAGFYEIQYITNFFENAPLLKEILFQKVLLNSFYGFFLGFIRLKSNKLYPSLIIHAILNLK